LSGLLVRTTESGMTGLLSLVVVRKLVDLGGHAEEDMFCVSMSGSVVGFGLRMGRHWQKISVQLTGWYSPG
jgi:hypothetical protein